MEAQFEMLSEMAKNGDKLNFGQDFFVKFYQAFLYSDRWQQYFKGVGTTLLVTAIALVLGVVLGAIVAMVRVGHAQQKPHHRNPILGVLNAVCQVYVTVIRGISLDEIEFSDLLRVIWKEIRVAVVCGATLAAANFVKLMLVDKMIFGNPITITVALVICLTLVVTVFAAKVVGCTLPLLAKKIGFDPAVMASPFITTVVDAISLMIYFNFASLLLGI